MPVPFSTPALRGRCLRPGSSCKADVLELSVTFSFFLENGKKESH